MPPPLCGALAIRWPHAAVRGQALQITVHSAATFAGVCDRLGDGPYDFVSVHMNHAAGRPQIRDGMQIANLHGATSCLGAMGSDGASDGAVAFALRDPDGAYGTALEAGAPDMRRAAAAATRKALQAASRVGEIPDLVWVAATPGAEEDVLAGIEDVVGPDVPIIGGSAADNAVAGDWFVFDGAGQAGAGVVVSVLFPSVPVSFAYHNGYVPTEHGGTVTRVEGRKVLEIDHRPAMQVYSDWTGGAVENTATEDASAPILSASTLWPLGREFGQLGNIPFYLLAHPAVAYADGSMDVFATLEEGEHLTLMHGTKQGLVERAGRVAALARQNRVTPATPPLGALMIYCGGCMLSVRDQLDDVVAGVNAALDGAPFAGAFTFGEQGNLIRGGNRHGNLMISCITFG